MISRHLTNSGWGQVAVHHTHINTTFFNHLPILDHARCTFTALLTRPSLHCEMLWIMRGSSRILFCLNHIHKASLKQLDIRLHTLAHGLSFVVENARIEHRDVRLRGNLCHLIRMRHILTLGKAAALVAHHGKRHGRSSTKRCHSHSLAYERLPSSNRSATSLLTP